MAYTAIETPRTLDSIPLKIREIESLKFFKVITDYLKFEGLYAVLLTRLPNPRIKKRAVINQTLGQKGRAYGPPFFPRVWFSGK